MKRKTSGCTLPEELIIDILLRLPVKTLVRSKCVCKSWRYLFTSPEFVKLHLNCSLERNSGVILLHSVDSSLSLASYDFNHPQRPEVSKLHLNCSLASYCPDMVKLAEKDRDLEIVGICNGVVCFETADVLVLYNPATREYKQVSKPIGHTSRVTYNCELEFAYDCISDDYKVLCITQNYGRQHDFGREAHVYSLKANSWKKITIPTYGYSVTPTPGVVANNSLYWVCNVNMGIWPMAEVIQRFDLSSETYDEMPFDIEGKTVRCHRLVVLMGRLHTMTYGNGIGIWMLNEDNCWVEIFHCSTPPYLKDDKEFMLLLPCAYSKDGHKILVGTEQAIVSLICCDLKSQTISPVQLLGLPKDDATTFISTPWVESLVSLG